jgi:ketosteroid isomerase-like protein
MSGTTGTVWAVPTADTLLDREMIREAMGRYCRGIDRLDIELIRSSYHEDAFDDHGPFKGTREEFIEWVVPFMRKEYTSTSHHLTSQSIEVDGDVAWVETYAIVVQQKPAGEQTLQLVANSRYADRFEKRDGDWRIARRVVILDTVRTDTVAPWAGTSPISSMTMGSRDTSDPSYRR